jgi:mono/diheme cytochrome c family protein
MVALLLLPLSTPTLVGCDSAPAPALSAEAERGRTVYAANCAACHNLDPSKPGGLGPAVKGSSRELLEARVLRGEYPPGYAPQRTSTLMQPLPQLSGDIDALAAYLK